MVTDKMSAVQCLLERAPISKCSYANIPSIKGNAIVLKTHVWVLRGKRTMCDWIIQTVGKHESIPTPKI